MTFSQFAQALYPFCNEGDNKPEFVRHLVDKIMGGQPGRMHADGNFQNPLRGLDDRVVLNYYNGERSISAKDASTIYSSISTEKFEKYIDWRCSLGAQDDLMDALQAVEPIEEDGYTVPEICTRLFVEILRKLAEK